MPDLGADVYLAATFHPAHLSLSELELSAKMDACLMFCLIKSMFPLFLINILLPWKKNRNLRRVGEKQQGQEKMYLYF